MTKFFNGLQPSLCTSEEKSSKTRYNHFYGKINIFTKEVTIELISRKFLSVIAFYSTFPHCVVCWKINVFTKFLQIEKKNSIPSLFSRIFFSRSLEGRRYYLATFYREKQQFTFWQKKSSTEYCTLMMNIILLISQKKCLISQNMLKNLCTVFDI